jgi:hypothetical protein
MRKLIDFLKLIQWDRFFVWLTLAFVWVLIAQSVLMLWGKIFCGGKYVE